MKLSKVLLGITKVGVIVGGIGGIAYVSKKSLEKTKDMEERYKAYYQLMNQWMTNKNDGKSIVKYFEENEVKNIAIYGMGTLGELFYSEIKGTDIKVNYFIDKNAQEMYYGLDDIRVVGIDEIENQDEVDAIIVTPIFDFDSISDDIEEAGCELEIISLEDIVYEI